MRLHETCFYILNSYLNFLREQYALFSYKHFIFEQFIIKPAPRAIRSIDLAYITE